MKLPILAAAGLLFASAAMADDATTTNAAVPQDRTGQFGVRLRAVGVVTDPSVHINVAGTAVGGTTKVSDSVIPEADFSYFFTNNLAVEVIAGVTKHSIKNSTLGNVASVWLLPPTVTAQYHFDPIMMGIEPYVGAGVNYTFYYDPKSALPGIGFKNQFGWALQAGADIPIADTPYFLNVDVKKIFLGTTGHAMGGAVQASARLNPWLIGTGVGIRF